MAGELCPYCGTLLTSSLRFCVNCRRSITEDKIRQAGVKRKPNDEEEEEEGGAGRYRLSRKTSYDGIRQARTVFTTLTTLLCIAFVYYFTMKFVIHQPIPFEQQIEALLNQNQSSPQEQTPPRGFAQPTSQPSPQPKPGEATPGSAQPGPGDANQAPRGLAQPGPGESSARSRGFAKPQGEQKQK